MSLPVSVRDIPSDRKAHRCGLYLRLAVRMLRPSGHLVKFATEEVRPGRIGGALTFPLDSGDKQEVGDTARLERSNP
jgi:hypothetical protein